MSGARQAVSARNGCPVSLTELEPISFEAFHRSLLDDLVNGCRVAALFVEPGEERHGLHAILADGASHELYWYVTEISDAYPSLTPDCPQVHWFEREIAEQWGIQPIGHPWLKPIRFHRSYREGHDAWSRPSSEPILPCVTDFFQVEGEEVHEVAVGPVHAGVIEPGHFRFQCHGEKVFHLEISLGYQHRGIERALWCGPDKRTVHYLETAAGDTTVGHATAYAQAIEGLAGLRPRTEVEELRAIALELERLANHTGDLGALANDVGYLPTASYCGRIRGDFLNMTALLCGNRFGRGLVRPGGLGVSIDEPTLRELDKRIAAAEVDVTGAVELLWKTPSVRARFENAGRISKDDCSALGLVGVAARASGLERDVRVEFPTGAYSLRPIPTATSADSNVDARARVRWQEIQASLAYTRELIKSRIGGEPTARKLESITLPACAGVVSMVEGWRGEICHVVLTNGAGRFALYKVIDPSFHNWAGLAVALRGQQISDFPLCNKSFNLSYCGHDL